MVSAVTDALAWVVVAGFAASALLDTVGTRARAQRWARGVAAGTWVAFAAFWLLLVPHYAFVQKSYIEGGGSALLVPVALYIGYLVWTRRPSLLYLSRAVAVMGLVYLPFQTVEALREVTVETVAVHAEFAIQGLGYHPIVATGDRGYRSVFVLTNGTPPHEYRTPVLLACSGIGSIATVSGLVLAVREPLRKRLAALAVVVPVIYALNILRVVFIVLAFSEQWFQLFVDEVMVAFGATDPTLVSYYVSDRVISQSLSVVVLLGLVWALLCYLPALAVYVEEVTYVLTGDEIDARERFGIGE